MVNTKMLSSALISCLLGVILIGCGASNQKTSDAPEPPKKTIGPGGPGDDNDRPVTVIGSSLMMSWFESVTLSGPAWTAVSAAKRRYKDTNKNVLASAARKVNSLSYRYDARDADPIVILFDRLADKQLGVTIYYQVGTSGAVTKELAFETADDGTNLEYFKPDDPGSPTLRILGKRLRRHPSRMGRVIHVEFTNVTTANSLTGSGCTVLNSVHTCVVNNPGNAVRNNNSIEFTVMP